MSDADTEGACIVVIGASAGGVDALVRFTSQLPSDFAAPIVVAQHADPKGSGRLAEILQRQTRLHIDTVPANDDELKAGHIYLAPPGRSLTIKDHRVFSVERQQGHPVPSIDLLFSTAAQAFGDRAIAVILTGMGTDGVAGVRAVKEFGGTVVVQEIESAAYPALPGAIPMNYVDFTSTIDDLSSLLTTLISHGDSDLSADKGALDAFLGQVRGRSGIDFRQYKTPTIRRRLVRLMAAAQCNTLADYLRYLNSHPDAYQRLVSSFLVKVTGFFRDPPLYRTLKESVLPSLLQDAKRSASEVRLWSAGCATGEEAYSLAILLAELLGDDLEKVPIRIFATDLDAYAIDFARRGIYPATAFEDVPPELVAKYFTAIDGRYQVKKRIRNLTVFGEYDLGQRAPFPRIDLVMCRNVLIYFTKELQSRTLQLFAFSLRQGGYLVLGKAETTSPLPEHFVSMHPGQKIYKRQGERLLIPGPVLTDGLRVAEPYPAGNAARRNVSRRSVPVEEPRAPRWSLIDRLGTFLFESDIGIVVVDRHYDILTINQAARRLFGIAGQAIGDDLIHLAQVPAADLRAALDAAFRGEMPSVGLDATVRDLGEDEERFLHVTCHPDRTLNKDGRTEGVIVLVVDWSALARQLNALRKECDEKRSTVSALTKHNNELADRQRALMEANEELSTANVDLRNVNEHLMISAEEAEASAEEVETLNEEMQATSEELETLNEELHATVEELNTTNEELGARTEELERAARDRQQQLDTAVSAVATLRAVLTHVPIALCIVDKQSKVSIASERYAVIAQSNSELLPQVGQKWRRNLDRLTLRENGREHEYAFRRFALPDNGGDTMIILSHNTQ